MIDRKCEVCGTSFRVAPSRLKHGRGVHCSRDCQYAARSAAKKKPRVTLTCIGCGRQFDRLKSSMNGKAGAGKYCSRQCRDEHWVGPLNPNYQDGSRTHDYGPHWYSQRRAAIDRDNRECQHCGASADLHVHHQVPFRMFDDSETANGLWNLITLCAACHRREEAKWKWLKIGQSVIRMTGGGEAWRMHKALVASNDNQPLTFGDAQCVQSR